MSTYIAYFDGACAPSNPGGHLGMGAVVTKVGCTAPIFEASRHRAPSAGNTNNVAEYGALWYVLDYFIRNNLQDADIMVKGDSQLVIKQMSGEWTIKEGNGGVYIKAAVTCRELVATFKRIRFQWIPRDDNWWADKLSNACLIERGVKIPDWSKKR